MRPAAVERGADATRLVVPGPDGRPEPVAVLPSGTTVATALDELVGPRRGPVAVVHPPGGSGITDLAGDVRPVPAPVAVLAGRSGRFLVVDAGRSGTTLTVVADGCVRSTARVPVGGDRLDALITGATGCPAGRARRVREALSVMDRLEVPGYGPLDASTVEAVLRPEFDDVVGRVPSLAAGVEEVVVAGGLARAPLLAEMLDERVRVPVRVLPEPDLAAVRGALRWLETAAEPGPEGVAPGGDAAVDRVRAGDGDRGSEGGADPDPGGADADDAGDCGAVGGGAVGGDVGGGVRSRGMAGVGVEAVPRGEVPNLAVAGEAVNRRRAHPTRARRGLVLPGVAVVGVLLVGAGTVLGTTEGPPAPPSGTLVQYGYSVALPAGWEHTGGDPERRRTLLTRTSSPEGVELVSVERSPLGYDTAAEPDRARAELAIVHAASGDLGELRPDTIAGRAVTRYRQQAGPDAVVDWFVLFDGTDELVVGCRRPARGAVPETERACADVVGSVRTVDRPG